MHVLDGVGGFGLMQVKQMLVKPGMTVGQLVDEMGGCGVLGAGRLAKATDVLVDMFEDHDYTVFLALAGPMVAGGLRNVIGDLVDRRYVDVIVTSGANIVHDITEALGYRHIRGSFMADDSELRGKDIARVGDVYIEQEAFEALEKKMYKIFNGLPQSKRGGLSTCELLSEAGKRLNDPESILTRAWKRNVLILSPGLLDSMIGLHAWTYSQLKKLQMNPILDLQKMSDVVFNSKKSGAIILGGGLPKHFVLGANILREGVDAAVQITLDRPEGGSLSGAPLEEAISWKKAKVESKLVTVIGDATMVFPMMVAAALEKLH